jgi:hypothetical protein
VLDPHATANWALSVLDGIKHALQVDPIVYTGAWFMGSRCYPDPALAAYDLWLSAYPIRTVVTIGGLTMPGIPAPWSSMLFWQFADEALTPGIGPIDADWCSDENFPRLFCKSVPTPLPAQEMRVNAITTDPVSHQTVELDLHPDGVIQIKNITVQKWDTVPGLDQAKYGKPISLSAEYRWNGDLDVSVKTDRGVIVRCGWPKGAHGFDPWWN